jgi:hypothetical protein
MPSPPRSPGQKEFDYLINQYSDHPLDEGDSDEEESDLRCQEYQNQALEYQNSPQYQEYFMEDELL